MTTSIPSISNYRFDGKAFVSRARFSFAPVLFLAVFFVTMLHSAPAVTEQLASIPTGPQAPAPVLEVKSEPESVLSEAVSYIRNVNPSLSSQDASDFAMHIVSSAQTFKLDVSLVLALISVESKFKPEAVSKAGAIGLTQVIPKYHADRIQEARAATSAYSLFEPKLNIYVGVGALKDWVSTSKSLDVALLKYNGSLSDDSKSYSKAVLSEMRRAKKWLASGSTYKL